MNTFRSRMHEDHGVVAVVVALLMIVFLGLAALTVDMGYHYTVKRQLQASADAAALAGVRELLVGSTEAEILGIAEEYALLNGEAPGNDLSMVDGAPLTQVGANFVRVTVERQSPQFFGRMFVADDPLIQATAEARVAYVTGMSGLVPVGLPILRATRVHAWLEGDPSGGTLLSKTEGGTWVGSLPVPALAAGSSRKVNLTVYNEQDFPMDIPGVSVVHALDSASLFQSVTANPSVVVNHPGVGVDPGSVTIGVVGTGQTTVRLNKATLSGTDSYTVSMSSPGTGEMRQTFGVDLFLGGKATGQPDLKDAAIVNSVRSTYPLKFLNVGNRFFTPGVAGTANIEVGLHDYDFGVIYHMKLDSDAEVGNFGPIVFDQTGGNTYRDYLENGYDGEIYIGQILETEPGNMTGPTNQGLKERLNGPEFEEWVAQGMPRDSSRLVYVPVLEQIEKISGRSRLIVVSFAAFYLEQPIGDADFSGRFIEYVTPSDMYSDVPPDSGMYLETYRLVTPETEL